jgi:L-alanine-DL-glutamate epimerase-like enolase superfamily enzyme
VQITKITPLYLEPTLLVKVETDEGITGWGECSPMNPRVTAAVLNYSLIPLVIGRDPFDLEKTVEKMLVKTYKLAGQSQAIAISGIEIALWDIMGKALGVPVYKLLGGAYRDKIRMYASSLKRDISPEDEANRMANLVEKHGFTAVKVKVGNRNGFDVDYSPGRSLAVVRETRRLLGDDIEIMVDANSGFSAARAIQLGRRLEEYNIFHYEEPCPNGDFEATAKVTAALDVPVAGGEQEWDLRRFKQLLHDQVVDIIQPDLIKAGGFSCCKKIAALAEAYGAICTPHQTNPLGLVANLHFAAATPVCRYAQEYRIDPHPTFHKLFKESLVVVDGYLNVPTAPGLGVELNEELLEKAEVL